MKEDGAIEYNSEEMYSEVLKTRNGPKRIFIDISDLHNKIMVFKENKENVKDD